MTWATKYAPPSAVLGYTALQPLTSSLLVLIITSCTSKYNLSKPGYNLLGGILIIAGLYFLVADALKTEKLKRQEAAEQSGSDASKRLAYDEDS